MTTTSPADDRPVRPSGRGGGRPGSDYNHWNWLLLLPIVLPLLVPLFNRIDPGLGGFPFFYWIQLVFILVGVATTTLVYQLTRRRRRGADSDAVHGTESGPADR